jgi:hypothetical protein
MADSSEEAALKELAAVYLANGGSFGGDPKYRQTDWRGETPVSVDPSWVFHIPRPADPKEAIDAWIAEVADDIERSGSGYQRPVAEAAARDMLAQEWKWSLPFDPDEPESIEDWRSYAVEEMELSDKLPRARAEETVRHELETMMTAYRRGLAMLAERAGVEATTVKTPGDRAG